MILFMIIIVKRMCRNDKKERDPERVRVPSTEFIEKSNTYSELELRACSNQRLTGFVAFELSEVLDEAASQVFSLLFPLGSLSIRIARIEDLRIYARQFSRNYKVEVRDRLRRSLVNGAVQDGVDSSAYFVGCKLKKAAPKQAENVGVGSVMPRSVPANLAVKPDRK